MGFLRLLAWSFMTAVFGVMLLAGIGYWLYSEAEAPGPLAEQQTIVIPPHSSIVSVAEMAGEGGVVWRPPAAFQHRLGRRDARRARRDLAAARFPARRQADRARHRAEARRIRIPG